tara:strand:- start:721 stop:1794 length:1074 start_codon:yes stop_codon:yes gene_type:complete
MNIHFTRFDLGEDSDGKWRTEDANCYYKVRDRIKPFYSTLLKTHNISCGTPTNPEPINGADIWFIDCGSCGTCDEVDQTKLIKNIENFKGKLIFYDLHDAGVGAIDCKINLGVYPHLFKRADAIVAGTKNYRISDEVARKTVLVPRFLTPPKERDFVDSKRQNRIVFRGSDMTSIGRDCRDGDYWLHVPRAQIIKYLESYNYEWIDVKLVDKGESPNFFKYWPEVNEHYLSFDNWLQFLKESLVCIALPAAITWTYRHLEAMSCGAAVISQTFEKPYDHEWMYRDKVLDLFFYFKSDLSDLIDICEYCINNRSECIEKGKRGYQVYDEYFRLASDHTYTDKVWKDVQRQFIDIGINI